MTTPSGKPGWTCPVCGGRSATPRWRVESTETELGVDGELFRPSSDRYGETSGVVVRCTACGHGSLESLPGPDAMAIAYGEAADPVSEREWDGRVKTADRGLRWMERHVTPGSLVDLGCWSGAFLDAARRRGWMPVGVEPSTWAVGRGRARGLDVRQGDLFDHGLVQGDYRAVVLCDVLEHLSQPAAALDVVSGLLDDEGVLYLTVPDAGSALARVMGRRWWSVLPMHVQYFTRASMTLLLQRCGFDVVGIRSHPKVFTAAYYAERLSGYSGGLHRVVDRALRRVHIDERLVGPDFHDRMQVLAVRRARRASVRTG
jgi:SAM-dependent methyltransferase